MKLFEDPYSPIRKAGIFITILGVFFSLHFFRMITDSKFSFLDCVIFGTFSTYHLATGIGLVMRRKWSLFLFKPFLVILGLGPASWKYLKYLDEKNIKRYLK